MVRITADQKVDRLIVKIAGKLERQHITLLDEELQAADGRMVLDLSELQSADSEGLQKIQALMDKGTSVTGMQPFIALRLQRLREDFERNQH